MILRITIDNELYKELKDHAKAENQFIMGYCNKLFTEKVEETLKQVDEKKPEKE